MEDAEVERLTGGRPRLTYEDIVAHPHLREAARVYVDRFLAVYDEEPFLVRLLIEAGRHSIVQLVMMLEAAYEPARRETWPTLGRIKDMMAAFGLASGRHVDELIGRLCEVGFLELCPSEHDRRSKILKGTERLWTHDREWLAAHFAPLAICYPQHNYGPVERRDPRFQVQFRGAAMPFAPLGAKLVHSVPDMLMFFEHAGGYMVVAALLQAAFATGDPSHATVPYGDVGERFGLSRTHVRRLLGAAAKAGLVELHTRGGHRVEILPRLWASHDRGMSCGMYFHDLIYVETVKGHALPSLVAAAEGPDAAARRTRGSHLRRVK
jgi:DNA-binding MarR family transcriptional regulator